MFAFPCYPSGPFATPGVQILLVQPSNKKLYIQDLDNYKVTDVTAEVIETAQCRCELPGYFSFSSYEKDFVDNTDFGRERHVFQLSKVKKYL